MHKGPKDHAQHEILAGSRHMQQQQQQRQGRK
jgi:hypothetical protein